MSTFTAYIFGSREHYEYHAVPASRSIQEGYALDSGTALVKKDFPFPESLLSLLYFNVHEYQPLFESIVSSLQSLLRTEKPDFAVQAIDQLRQLADGHIYFELVSQKLQKRLWAAQQCGFKGAQNLLSPWEIAYIPTEVSLLQKQIMALFQNVLDIDSFDLPVPEKMARYYGQTGKDSIPNLFRFRALPIGFEAVETGVFAEVLRPHTIWDLVDFHLRECVRQEVKAKVCKNCGRYFIIRGRTTAQYCDRGIGEDGQTCKSIGAFRTWEHRKSDDHLFIMYRREYKKRFAWIRAGKLPRETFYAWGKMAREKKRACEAGAITPEEFELWLKQS